jgi:hypothetical protein
MIRSVHKGIALRLLLVALVFYGFGVALLSNMPY